MPKDFHPNFMATGIGSLPHLDPERAVDDVLSRLTGMPYWPQLPKRSPNEDMALQYAPALTPLVEPDAASRSVKAHPNMSREEALAAFYERLFSGDLKGFELIPGYADGFFAYLRRVEAAPKEAFPWLKGHVTGPCTFTASVMGDNGKTLLYDDEAAEALARGLGISAAAQVGQLAHLNRPMMMFIDEPFLTGFGSAFTPISRERIIELLGYTLEELSSRCPEVISGVHCCGNTDWAMLIEAGFDVINLDSDGYGEGILLYPDALKELFARNGAVAWGAVPAGEFKGTETAEGLWDGLKALLTELEAKGLDRAQLASQALVSPACGLGSLNEDQARQILDLTARVSELAKKEYA